MNKFALLVFGATTFWAPSVSGQTATDSAHAQPSNDTAVNMPVQAESTPAPAAGVRKKGSLYAGAGVGFPATPEGFKSNWNMGYGGGLGMGYAFSRFVEATIWFDYSSYPLDIPSGLPLEGGTFSSMEFVTDLKLILVSKANQSRFRPYFAIGAGVASEDIAQLDSTSGALAFPGDHATALAFHGCIGFEFWTSPSVAIWVDARSTSALTDPETTGYLPIRAGVKVLTF